MSFNFLTLGLLVVALVELVSAATLPPACNSLQKKFPDVTFLPQSTNYATEIARESRPEITASSIMSLILLVQWCGLKHA